MMNIETNSKITTTTQATATNSKPISTDMPKFSEELNNLSKDEKIETTEESLSPSDNGNTIDNVLNGDKHNCPSLDKVNTKLEEKNSDITNITNNMAVQSQEIGKLQEKPMFIQPNDTETPKVKPESKDLEVTIKQEIKPENPIDEVFDGLKNTVEEIHKVNNKKVPQASNLDENKGEVLINDNEIIKNFVPQNKSLTQTEEKPTLPLKDVNIFTDKEDESDTKKDDVLINNDMNIQEPKEPLMPQMNANMNFNSNGQPFSEFMSNQQEQNQLSSSEKDLAEETAILSTMSENIAIANRNMALAKPEKKDKPQNIQKVELMQTNMDIVAEEIAEPKIKTVSNTEGIKKVDTKSNITVETVVKYDTVIMDKNDVEFFTKLVENGSVEMETAQANKSVQVSKTLADLIAKAAKDNQPVRIDFDNDISVIIKIGKDGKISADFLPSSQIAETYLKENLPLLKQRFDENNIEYDELNQRKQKQNEKEDRKKGRKDE